MGLHAIKQLVRSRQEKAKIFETQTKDEKT